MKDSKHRNPLTVSRVPFTSTRTDLVGVTHGVQTTRPKLSVEILLHGSMEDYPLRQAVQFAYDQLVDHAYEHSESDVRIAAKARDYLIEALGLEHKMADSIILLEAYNFLLAPTISDGNVSLKVNPQSSILDRTMKTRGFNEAEREEMEVSIIRGQFKKNAKPFSTTSMISHGKRGFAAFTWNMKKELHLFNHHGMVDKVAHSSINNGADVQLAGELQIENGRLLAITTHSGHYQPSLLEIQHFLQYLEKEKNVDISNVEIQLFKNPSSILGLNIPKGDVLHKDILIQEGMQKAMVRKYCINAATLSRTTGGYIHSLIDEIEADLKVLQVDAKDMNYTVQHVLDNLQLIKAIAPQERNLHLTDLCNATSALVTLIDYVTLKHEVPVSATRSFIDWIKNIFTNKAAPSKSSENKTKFNTYMKSAREVLSMFAEETRIQAQNNTIDSQGMSHGIADSLKTGH